MKKENLTGIIMAGGKSSRMGKNKALVEIKGKPMIAHVHGILKNICTEIIISANDDKEYIFLKERIVHDEFQGLGPIGGIYSCLKKSDSEINLILACDIPFISEEFLRFLLRFKNEAQIIIPESDKGIEPLCAVYNKSVLKDIEVMIKNKEYKIQNIINYCSYKIIKPGYLSQDIFLNINSPHDIKND